VPDAQRQVVRTPGGGRAAAAVALPHRAARAWAALFNTAICRRGVRVV